MRRKTSGDADQDSANLSLALLVMLHIIGHEVTLPAAAFEAVNGKFGLRARYEEDGSMTLWAYDLDEDLKNLMGGPVPRGQN